MFFRSNNGASVTKNFVSTGGHIVNCGLVGRVALFSV